MTRNSGRPRMLSIMLPEVLADLSYAPAQSSEVVSEALEESAGKQIVRLDSPT